MTKKMVEYEEMTDEKLDASEKSDELEEPGIYFPKDEPEYIQLDSDTIILKKRIGNKITGEKCFLMTKNSEYLSTITPRKKTMKEAIDYVGHCNSYFGIYTHIDDSLFKGINWILKVLYTNDDPDYINITNSVREEAVALAAMVIGLIQSRRLNIYDSDRSINYFKVPDELERLNINLYEFIMKSFKTDVQFKMINDTNSAYAKILMKMNEDLQIEDIERIVVKW